MATNHHGVAGIITLVKEFRALDRVKLEGTLPFLKSPISLNLPSSVGVCNHANNNLVTSCQGTRLDSKRGGTYGKGEEDITPTSSIKLPNPCFLFFLAS